MLVGAGVLTSDRKCRDFFSLFDSGSRGAAPAAVANLSSTEWVPVQIFRAAIAHMTLFMADVASRLTLLSKRVAKAACAGVTDA